MNVVRDDSRNDFETLVQIFFQKKKQKLFWHCIFLIIAREIDSNP